MHNEHCDNWVCEECRAAEGEYHYHRCSQRREGAVKPQGKPSDYALGIEPNEDIQPLQATPISKEVFEHFFPKKEYIILPRPKGKTIAKSLDNFIHSYRFYFNMSDDEFNREWSDFLKSLEK